MHLSRTSLMSQAPYPLKETIMNSYRLVACSFHDELEALATLQQSCQILYRDSDGDKQAVTTKIIDVYAAKGADFVTLQEGTVIRLDHLISINEKPIQFANPPFTCS